MDNAMHYMLQFQISLSLLTLSLKYIWVTRMWEMLERQPDTCSDSQSSNEQIQITIILQGFIIQSGLFQQTSTDCGLVGTNNKSFSITSRTKFKNLVHKSSQVEKERPEWVAMLWRWAFGWKWCSVINKKVTQRMAPRSAL